MSLSRLYERKKPIIIHLNNGWIEGQIEVLVEQQQFTVLKSYPKK